jgi:hypothetical protein
MAVAAPETRLVDRTGVAAHRSRPPRRRPRLAERLTLNVVVGLLAALVAFVVAGSLLADRREMTSVAVAREQIAPVR